MDKVTKFYDSSWERFGESQKEEAEWRLYKRWTMNNIPFSIVEGKNVLDLGCGSGRYSSALLKFGARKVVGFDAHKPSFEARDFEFVKGDILKLPFSDGEFDFVFCNGVLHHTKDWKMGLAEASRVLRSGGHLWLYVLRINWTWALADRIRKKCDEKDAEAFQKYLEARGWPPNKIFFLKDCFFVPHRVYLSETDVQLELSKNGFWDVRLLAWDFEDIGTDLRYLAKKNENGLKGD